MDGREPTTISTIGMPRRDNGFRTTPAFTLVELILVMALLAILLALVAPSLSRSSRARKLENEAARLLALTEYARSEAVSQGVPTTVWIDPAGKRFGAEARAGYPADAVRQKEFNLDPDIRFELDETPSTQNGIVYAMEFAPDGTPDSGNVYSVRLLDRSNSAIALTQTQDEWGYEIVKDQ